MEYIEAKSNINVLPNRNDLIQRFAEIQGITYEEAEQEVGAETEEEIMSKITDFTIKKINSGVKLNRA